uniref:Gem-associated protein 6 n=1 Tax=Phytophthora ramorum TaxID=164328 RepID=H3GKS7_PHYRM
MASERSLFDQFSTFVGLPVRVQVQDGTVTDGVLYCIDPDTDHVALLCPSGQQNNVKIVLAHHVRGIEKDEGGDLPTLAALQEELGGEDNSNGSLDDAASLQCRREQLCVFLTSNFVPFQVAADGSLRVFGGAATLCAPFRAVQCANEQLLRRLQQLLTQFNQQQQSTRAHP